MIERNRIRMGRDFIAERRTERLQYGETVYLLEPNREALARRPARHPLAPLAVVPAVRRRRLRPAARHGRAVEVRPPPADLVADVFAPRPQRDALSRRRGLRSVDARRAAAAGGVFSVSRPPGIAAGRAVHARLLPPHEPRLAPGASAVGAGAAAVAREPRVRAGAGLHDEGRLPHRPPRDQRHGQGARPARAPSRGSAAAGATSRGPRASGSRRTRGTSSTAPRRSIRTC